MLTASSTPSAAASTTFANARPTGTFTAAGIVARASRGSTRRVARRNARLARPALQAMPFAVSSQKWLTMPSIPTAKAANPARSPRVARSGIRRASGPTMWIEPSTEPPIQPSVTR